MKRFLRENGLSLVMFGLFAVFLVGQSVTGYLHHQEELREHGQATLGFLPYLRSGAFLESVFENWESEFLQMGLYVLLTAFLFQKGSAESKSLEGGDEVDEDPEKSQGKPGVPGPVRKGGLALKIYNQSLSIALLSLFALSFGLHAWSGALNYNQDQIEHGQAADMTALKYLATSQFWFESFQNWQSEFLSVAAIVVLSIFLRQKGSPESKPVAARHDEEG